MKISPAGLDLIITWEGEKLKAYRDSTGVWTIGVGHTSAAGAPKVTKGMTITKAESREILDRDLKKWEKQLEGVIKVPLTDNQYSVIVSFVHNLGIGSLKSSTLLKKLNAGQYDAVPSELMKWVNAGGKRVQGLVNRRRAEAVLWQQPDGPSHDVNPVKPDPTPASKEPQEHKQTSLLSLILGLLQKMFGRS